MSCVSCLCSGRSCFHTCSVVLFMSVKGSSVAKLLHLSLHHESWKLLKPCCCIFTLSLLYEFVFSHGNVWCVAFLHAVVCLFSLYSVLRPRVVMWPPVWLLNESCFIMGLQSQSALFTGSSLKKTNSLSSNCTVTVWAESSIFHPKLRCVCHVCFYNKYFNHHFFLFYLIFFRPVRLKQTVPLQSIYSWYRSTDC